jgi:hypothetical protein
MAAMPARSQRRSFPERQIREHLETFRDEGLGFEAAYVLALRRTDWPHETDRRRSFRAVFLDAAVKAEWRAC